jgi:heme a synthase
MNKFRSFSNITISLTYLLIFIGGLVRVSGAGMGCPDWPKCFDRWIPPTRIEQLPDHIDPALFNIVLAWIEYCNRLFGVFVGLFITITMFLALRNYYSNLKIKWSVISAFILTLVQGWLGSVLVHTVLNPITITLHLILALIIVLLLVYASQTSFYIEFPKSEEKSRYSSGLKIYFLFLLGILIIEIILGTEIRGGLEMIRKENPIIDSQFLLDMLGPFKYAHTIFGILIALISSYLWYHLSIKGKNPSALIKVTSTLIVFLVYGQIFLGEMLVFFDVIPLLQLFHLWFASLILGLVMMQFVAWKQSLTINE